MKPFDSALLDASAGALDALEDSEDRCWALLVGLRAAALHQASADVPDLARMEAWAGGAVDDDVPAFAERSLLIAELLEETLLQTPAAPADRHRLVASTRQEASPEPFPATYAAAEWTAVLGLDESDRLFVALDRAPTGDTVALDLPDLDRGLQARVGEVHALGAAAELLGAEPVFNPVRSLRVRSGSGSWTTLRRTP